MSQQLPGLAFGLGLVAGVALTLLNDWLFGRKRQPFRQFKLEGNVTIRNLPVFERFMCAQALIDASDSDERTRALAQILAQPVPSAEPPIAETLRVIDASAHERNLSTICEQQLRLLSELQQMRSLPQPQLRPQAAQHHPECINRPQATGGAGASVQSSASASAPPSTSGGSTRDEDAGADFVKT